LHRVDFPFQAKDVEKAISLYYLGTIAYGYRTGGITFPFIDRFGNVRAVQVKEFDETNHTTSTDFLHSIIKRQCVKNNMPLPEWLLKYTEQDKLITCLFGEHLLTKYPRNPVALVEAPKTAIYGALYFGFPELPTNLIWLAVYNRSSFSFDKLKALEGRNVIVFPDLSKDGSTFNEWQEKAQGYQKQLIGTRFIFSDFLEKNATEIDRLKGSDLADYLIRMDWRNFRTANPTKVQKKIYQTTIHCNAVNEYQKKKRIESQSHINELHHILHESLNVTKFITANQIEFYVPHAKKEDKSDSERLQELKNLIEIIKN